jgi:2-polyprenyl-3-methyl-5-hydroxy-6-metoxy-1,4-benzoquinol methylase
MINILKNGISSVEGCPVCGSRDVILWHQYGGNDHVLKKCKSCGLRFQPQRKNCSFEPHIYDSKVYRELRAKIELRTLSVAKSRLDYLLKAGLSYKSRILEIGSNTGEFLHVVQKEGFEVYGIEPSAGLVEYSKKRFKIKNVKVGHFPEVAFVGAFDVIVILHVLEHIENPYLFMKQIKSKLKPAGVLYIRVPNGNGFYLNLFSFLHPHFRQYDHYYHYASHHLERILKSEGLEIVSLSSHEDSNNIYTTLYYMLVPLLTQLSKKPLMHWLKTLMNPNIAYWMGSHTKWLHYFWLRFLCKHMMGGELAVIARLKG